jgi:hypothetical protein
LLGTGLPIEEELKTAFEKYFGSTKAGLVRSSKVAGTPDVDPETLEQLKSLGYIN